MIPGTGPGRGFPWWRGIGLIIIRQAIGRHGAEPAGQQREGRLVVRIRRPQ